MTKEEATAILNAEADFLFGNDNPYNRKAFDMAISALSENKGDLISRQAVKDIILGGVSTDTDADKEYVCGLIDNLPCECRPKGEWIRKVHYLAICWECSNCGHNSNYYSPLYNFCPDCGSDMRGE